MKVTSSLRTLFIFFISFFYLKDQVAGLFVCMSILAYILVLNGKWIVGISADFCCFRCLKENIKEQTYNLFWRHPAATINIVVIVLLFYILRHLVLLLFSWLYLIVLRVLLCLSPVKCIMPMSPRRSVNRGVKENCGDRESIFFSWMLKDPSFSNLCTFPFLVIQLLVLTVNFS